MSFFKSLEEGAQKKKNNPKMVGNSESGNKSAVSSFNWVLNQSQELFMNAYALHTNITQTRFFFQFKLPNVCGFKKTSDSPDFKIYRVSKCLSIWFCIISYNTLFQYVTSMSKNNKKWPIEVYVCVSIYMYPM